jgi:hypothetical protein
MEDAASAAPDATDLPPDLPKRARVRTFVIQPLQEAGLVRSPRMKAGDHDAMLDRMQDRLAYLPDGLLSALAEALLRLADGPLQHHWPAWATVWNTACRLMPPPDDESHIMTSWLASIEGPVARAGGYLVELHAFLRRTGRPPGNFEMSKIRTDAQDNQRRRARVEEWIAKGHAKTDDRDWLDAYLRRLAHCEALVAGGEEKRATKGQAA